MANCRWYKQYDGVAMGSALAVILANLWLSQYEGVLSGTDTTLSVSSSRPNTRTNIKLAEVCACAAKRRSRNEATRSDVMNMTPGAIAKART